MEARFETANRPQVQRKEIEEQSAVRLRGQRHHFAFLVLPGVVVDPLEVGGFSSETRAVVHQLAINLARRKIDERHFVVDQLCGHKFSIRGAGRPAIPPRVPIPHCLTDSFRDSRAFFMAYFSPWRGSVTAVGAETVEALLQSYVLEGTKPVFDARPGLC